MLPTQYGEQGLRNGRSSVCLSHQSTAVGGSLLLSVLWVGITDR